MHSFTPPSDLTPAEQILWDRAGAAAKLSAGLAPPSVAALRTIAREEGVDYATTLLYRVMRQSEPHAAFADAIDLWSQVPVEPVPATDVLVGIIPAAFYREMPHTGADGRVIAQVAADLGLACERIPIASTGTLAENAAVIRRWLHEHRHRRILLASLCKGGADVRATLDQADATETFAAVTAWINICGSVHGSPFARWLLTTKPRFIATWLYCKCRRHDFRMLRELAAGPGDPLASSLRLPPGLALVNVAGFPLRRHLSNAFMRRCHSFIAPEGPNDGGILLGDACQLPGLLYPVWGADHYLRPDQRARRILTAIFQQILLGSTPGCLSRPPVAEGNTAAPGQCPEIPARR
jgi:hypothetical protein